MNDAQYDVTAIGNAIVDVLAQSTDEQLNQLNLAKGAMSLIDAADADEALERREKALSGRDVGRGSDE